MEVSGEDPVYVERFKTAFHKALSEQQANINNGLLKIASALDPHFKDLPRGGREEVWTNLEALLPQSPQKSQQRGGGT